MPTLDWLNRAEALTIADKVPYRVLDPVSEHGDGNAANLLIQGDNLDALKALLPFYRGRVKCIFIDPPYNTKSAFEHYDDNLEHSQWLTMMQPRLVLLRELLHESGSIWVTIDDNEGHYLKVLMDEVFGRQNFVANVVWEKSDSPKMDSLYFSSRHDHMLVTCKDSTKFKLKRLQTETAAHYDKEDESGRSYYLKPLRAMGGQGDSRDARPNLYYPMRAPDGTDVYPIRTDGKDGAWRWSRLKVQEEMSRIEWRRGRNGWSAYFRIYADQGTGRPAETIWTHQEAGSNRTSKAEVKSLFNDAGAFTTPKPEALIKRVLELTTDEGNLVLDSFLGSGTTAAVAHKMGRRWIGIEMGEHAVTHCIPRLQKVIEGEQGGISQAVNWQGGGGFRFLRLGEPMFNADGSIHPAVRFATLASFVWMQETGAPLEIPPSPPFAKGGDTASPPKPPLKKEAGAAGGITPLLGVHEGRGIYLLFNGILGDKRPASGNVLTNEVLAAIARICPHDGAKIIFGEACRLGVARLAAAGVTFKHIPYDVKAR